jgi:hypothetical protein
MGILTAGEGMIAPAALYRVFAGTVCMTQYWQMPMQWNNSILKDGVKQYYTVQPVFLLRKSGLHSNPLPTPPDAK